LESRQKDPAGDGPKPVPRRKGRWVKRLLVVLFLAVTFFVFGFLPYAMVDRVVVRGFTLPDR